MKRTCRCSISDEGDLRRSYSDEVSYSRRRQSSSISDLPPLSFSHSLTFQIFSLSL
ncbi:hypothetical protein HanRHA438_Chr05g0224151 [Helianthus annuus]|nr:hypothetical protein HanRHA438_Chr05g0224151 [Helianthus annuus]